MDESRTVWCGNLSEKVTEELLFELFLQAAPLEKVRIPTDRDGKNVNFGFVTFKHEESVSYALNLLHGTRLFDKAITVKPRSTNFQNSPVEKNVLRNDSQTYFNNSHKAFNCNELLGMGQLLQPNYDHSANYNDNRKSHWDHNKYLDKKSDYDYHDNRRTGSPGQRRNNYNDRRSYYNDRGSRRNNRHY